MIFPFIFPAHALLGIGQTLSLGKFGLCQVEANKSHNWNILVILGWVGLSGCHRGGISALSISGVLLQWG